MTSFFSELTLEISSFASFETWLISD